MDGFGISKESADLTEVYSIVTVKVEHTVSEAFEVRTDLKQGGALTANTGKVTEKFRKRQWVFWDINWMRTKLLE